MKRKELLEIKRRQLIRTLGTAVAVTPFISLVGCGDDDDDDDSVTATDTETGTDTDTDTDTGVDDTSEWASGGTASLQADFPPTSDPFATGLGNLCRTTREYTLGPCYFSPDEYRQDISEGEAGVPVILVLKLVDANCQPIEGADIDIWHCDRRGLYSGDSVSSSDSSSFDSRFCTSDNAEALASRWFRGVQTTDSEGMVYFKTCFPGWYPSRTTHIHFKVVQNGVQSLVSQFCFDDDLSNSIYLNHSEYTGEAKDTNNSTDNVFGSDYEDYLIVTERAFDNSMLAYKAIQLT